MIFYVNKYNKLLFITKCNAMLYTPQWLRSNKKQDNSYINKKFTCIGFSHLYQNLWNVYKCWIFDSDVYFIIQLSQQSFLCCIAHYGGSSITLVLFSAVNCVLLKNSVSYYILGVYSTYCIQLMTVCCLWLELTINYIIYSSVHYFLVSWLTV